MMNATPGFPCSEYHCSILPSRYRSTVSRTSSGRTANTCDCSKPGLMVPMARILVVGVVFIAAPCAFAELKPKRQPISASAAARANFMSSPVVASANANNCEVCLIVPEIVYYKYKLFQLLTLELPTLEYLNGSQN